jgi:hypothetical protein
MPEYCIYVVTGGQRHYSGPRKIIHCADDKEAIQAAEQWMDQHEVEVWENTRFIARLRPRGK